MKIYTKEMKNGQWSCYATIDGYDEQEFGDTAEDAQDNMNHSLEARGKRIDIEWVDPVPYTHEEKFPEPQITYAKNRIDNL